MEIEILISNSQPSPYHFHVFLSMEGDMGESGGWFTEKDCVKFLRGLSTDGYDSKEICETLEILTDEAITCVLLHYPKIVGVNVLNTLSHRSTELFSHAISVFRRETLKRKWGFLEHARLVGQIMASKETLGDYYEPLIKHTRMMLVEKN